MLVTSRIASCRTQCKETKAMKVPNNPVLGGLLIVCITMLIFTLLTGGSLCELSVKDGTREFVAKMAYESRR